MKTDKNKRKAAADKSNLPSCHTCRKHITQSTAITSEGKDYVWHFCGEVCYKQWKDQEK